MPTSSISQSLRLTDLPVPLQCRILSFLCEDERYPPLDVSLLYAGYLTSPLQKDFLALALASPHLVTTIAHVLGPRAVYLTDHIAGRDLPQWVTALSPFVKAVSLRDPILETLQLEAGSSFSFGRKSSFCVGPSEFVKKRSYENTYVDSLNLFRTISLHPIKLEVLDLSEVPFHKCEEREDELTLALYTTLEHNASSLREVSLPLERLCCNALHMATLRRLDVLELRVPRRSLNRFSFVSKKIEPDSQGRTLEDMLRAVDGHADRSNNVSTLRELRIHHSSNTFLKLASSKKFPRLPVLNAIQTLRITSMNAAEDSIAEESIVCLFPNLTCLYRWGPVRVKSLGRILRKCKKLENIHLCPYEMLSFQAEYFVRNPGRVERGAALCREKLRSVVLGNFDHCYTMFRDVGQNNPRLEYLSIPMNGPSIHDLKWLLGRKCRQLKRVDLRLPNFTDDRFWSIIRAAILNSSDALREVFITTDIGYMKDTKDLVSITRSLIDILKFLGDRGKTFSFKMLLLTRKVGIVVDAVSRILQTCAIHTRNLEALVLHYTTKDHLFRDFERSYANLWRSREELLAAVPSLFFLDLGKLGHYAKILHCNNS